MPGAKGKAEIKVVLPQALKAELDADAAAHGVDRSTWICMRLQTVDETAEGERLRPLLEHVFRDHAVMRDQLAQVITLIETFMAAVGKPAASAEKVYPTPATWEETYPELYAPKPPEPTPAVVVEPQAPAKRWPWQR
jgi:hypothetical protein